jgi:hypothetical protein
MSLFMRPTPEQHAALLAELGKLPLRGRAWPRWIGLLAWLILAAIAVRLIMTASSPAGQQIGAGIAASVLICYVALIVMAWYMWVSETEISESGIRQSWITRRQASWHDIKSARFIPFMSSKKLLCFMEKGRPVVFQAGTPELQAAFARISLAYSRRPQ